jgi:hypothetical protein
LKDSLKERTLPVNRLPKPWATITYTPAQETFITAIRDCQGSLNKGQLKEAARQFIESRWREILESGITSNIGSRVHNEFYSPMLIGEVNRDIFDWCSADEREIDFLLESLGVKMSTTRLDEKLAKCERSRGTSATTLPAGNISSAPMSLRNDAGSSELDRPAREEAAGCDRHSCHASVGNSSSVGKPEPPQRQESVLFSTSNFGIKSADSTITSDVDLSTPIHDPHPIRLGTRRQGRGKSSSQNSVNTDVPEAALDEGPIEAAVIAKPFTGSDPKTPPQRRTTSPYWNDRIETELKPALSQAGIGHVGLSEKTGIRPETIFSWLNQEQNPQEKKFQQCIEALRVPRKLKPLASPQGKSAT